MHSVFAPGFPGLLEAIYVQERLMEFLVPEVYTAFVCIMRVCADRRLTVSANAHDLWHFIRH
jgi:hypothetical protein